MVTISTNIYIYTLYIYILYIYILYIYIYICNLPKTNSLPLETAFAKDERIVFQPLIVRCYVSFREGKYTYIYICICILSKEV